MRARSCRRGPRSPEGGCQRATAVSASIALGTGVAFVLVYAVGVPAEVVSHGFSDPHYPSWLLAALWLGMLTAACLRRSAIARGIAAVTAAAAGGLLAIECTRSPGWWFGPSPRDEGSLLGWHVFDAIIGQVSSPTLALVAGSALIVLAGRADPALALPTIVVTTLVLLAGVGRLQVGDAGFWTTGLYDEAPGLQVVVPLAISAAAGIALLFARRFRAGAGLLIALLPTAVAAVVQILRH